MTLPCRIALSALALLVLPPSAAPGGGPGEEVSGILTDAQASGTHWRLETDRGPVHVWQPLGYEARTAGIVVYLHGYYTTADQTWREDNLASQFEASGQNALFIVPETPGSSDEAVQWPALDPLLEMVQQRTALPVSLGPVVVMGHSGAFRTVVEWLRDARVKDIVLLDGLYKNERDFYWWLQLAPGHPAHRLILVAVETLRKAERFVRRFGRVHQRASIPVEYDDFTPAERRARILLLRSQYEHMELVTSGRVVPVLLRFPALTALPRSPGSPAAGTR